MLEVHPWYTPTTISVALLLTSIYVVCFRGIQGIRKRGKSKKKKKNLGNFSKRVDIGSDGDTSHAQNFFLLIAE